jgi:hypothetical protein
MSYSKVAEVIFHHRATVNTEIFQRREAENAEDFVIR